LIHQWWWWWYVNSQGYHQFNNKIVIVLFTLICLFTIFAVISNCELYKSRNSSAIRVFVFLIWFLGVLSYIMMFWSLSVSHQHLAISIWRFDSNSFGIAVGCFDFHSFGITICRFVFRVIHSRHYNVKGWLSFVRHHHIMV
jgi:hypothetical protein